MQQDLYEVPEIDQLHTIPSWCLGFDSYYNASRVLGGTQPCASRFRFTMGHGLGLIMSA